MVEVPKQISERLASGERALWCGRPRQGLVLRGSDALQIPFSLLWCGFVIFWETGVVLSARAEPFFVLWGIPFVAIGIYMVIGRFFLEAYLRSKTWYALTTERILIVSGISSLSVKSLSLPGLSDITLTESGAGRGSITFGPLTGYASMFGRFSTWQGSLQQQVPCFDLIDDARQVHQKIRDAQRDLKTLPQ